ncbi:hypothetical protein SAMN03159306_02077 [Pseudomonas sp. NFACC48-1]|nr:hypothetical protein SAMN03159405_02282 [Pseudomonas sp. NFACC44-2]SDA62877.1 hypothetical protein SAMN03159429_02234 [Pseudomonas sp. NFACC51]SDX58958.1 hypothetical protein SAMN03159474_03394 [Pseudomonas sp. NFACC08-1]SFI72041.1 hypothetical protein SAMN03159302_04638 [Pseudomonas sp. NFACC54]SFS77997.1 hypothetical protein SAMN03159306_02077 [Pseudomonas sp. NFACC48-1]
MPQNCQIIGANSVTNSDRGKGVLPVSFIKKCGLVGKKQQVRICDRRIVSMCHTVWRITEMDKNLCHPCLVQDSGKWPIY